MSPKRLKVCVTRMLSLFLLYAVLYNVQISVWPSPLSPFTFISWQDHTPMFWSCTCFLQCLTAIVHTSSRSPTKSYLWIVFGGKRLEWHNVGRCWGCKVMHMNSLTITLLSPITLTLTVTHTQGLSSWRIESWSLLYIITENANNAWLARGIPYLNITQ